MIDAVCRARSGAGSSAVGVAHRGRSIRRAASSSSSRRCRAGRICRWSRCWSPARPAGAARERRHRRGRSASGSYGAGAGRAHLVFVTGQHRDRRRRGGGRPAAARPPRHGGARRALPHGAGRAALLLRRDRLLRGGRRRHRAGQARTGASAVPGSSLAAVARARPVETRDVVAGARAGDALPGAARGGGGAARVGLHRAPPPLRPEG